MKKSLLSLFLFIFLSGIVTAQEEEPQNQEKDNSINAQFSELIEDANDYQDYKVIKYTSIVQLQKNTVREIKTLNKSIENSNDTIESQKKEIAQLQQKLSNTNENLTNVTQEKDEISFLGIATNKGTYQTIMWVIILTLILILIFFVYKYRSSNVLTKEARENLAENEAEFEEYRKTALEKQQKLGRQLQDEKNRQASKG